MAIDSRILDGKGTKNRASVISKDGDLGLLVYTKQRYSPVPAYLPLLNVDFGRDMTQDVSAGGTPIDIHDGEDNTYWTGNNISGSTIDFNSTNRANTGTQSVRANSPSVGTIWEFDNGADQDLSSYVSITGFININRRWDSGDSVSMFGWRAGAQVGDKIFIEDYVTIGDNDVWQQFIVPLTAMNLDGQTIDAIRFEQESASGTTGDWFLDDFQIQESGTPIEYKTSKAIDKDYQVYEFIITMVDATAGTLADGAGQIPSTYNAILGVSELPVGITIRNVEDGENRFSANFRGLLDFLSAGWEISDSGSDGTNSYMILKQVFREPIVLKGAPGKNFISATINDNLSGLVKLEMALRGGEIENGD